MHLCNLQIHKTASHYVDIVGHLIYHIHLALYEFSHILQVAKFAYNYHTSSKTKPQTEMLV